MGASSPLHLLIVLVVALVVIGPHKLPETGAAIGKALREFRQASREDLPAAAVGPTAAVSAPASDPAPSALVSSIASPDDGTGAPLDS